MKNKKEKIEKVILGILTFVLIVYISFSLIFLSLYKTSEKFLNKKNVSEFIDDINIIDVLKEELGNEFDQIISIEEELKDIGITQEGLTEFVNSEDVKQFSGDLITNIFNKISDNQIYQINTEDVNKLIENNVDKLQINSSLSEEQIIDKLNSKMPSLISKMNEIIDKVCDELENSELFNKYQEYIDMSVNMLDIIYNNVIFYLIIFIIFTFIALLIFIRRNIYKSLKWLSISFIVPSVLLFILGYIIDNIKINNILVNNILNVIISKLNTYSLIYISVATLFVIINLVMYMIKNYKSKKNKN